MSEKLLSPGAGRTRALIGLAFALCFLFGTQAAHAAFPGANGKISFDRVTFPASAGSARIARGDQRPDARGEDVMDQIFTINPDGSAEVNISNNNFLDEDAGWSADGAKITYDTTLFDEPPGQVWTMNGDGSAQTNLTNNPDNQDSDPAWSPDGSRVVFTLRNSDTDDLELWIMNADGSNRHLLFTPTAGADDDFANWSPDGTKITFSRASDDLSQIYVVGADGSGTPQNLSNNSDWDEDPNWSPDGTQITFDKWVENEGLPQIWVMNADGSNPHEVAGDATSGDEAPAWSPDGTQIVYQHADAEVIKGARGFPFSGQEIWVVNANGSNNHQLTTPPDQSLDYVPDWQPVGRPASSAAFPTACTSTASVVVHAADPTHFISPLNVHYKVDGGAEQVAPVDAAGNAAIAVANGTHTVEYWAGDGAGYQEAAHHTGTVIVDTVHQCAPQVGVAGVRRACVAKTFRIRVHVSSAAGAPKSVKVFLGKKRIASTTKTSFTLKINPKKLGRRTRLRIVTTGSNGKVTTVSRTIARCAVAKKPRHKAAPRFTG